MEWTTEIGCAYSATLTPGASDADTVAVAIQLKDYAGNNLTVPNAVLAYLASDATGLTVNVTDGTTDLVAGTGSVAILTAYKAYLLVSDATGAIVVTLVKTDGAKDYYLVLVLPNGKRIVSSKIEIT